MKTEESKTAEDQRVEAAEAEFQAAKKAREDKVRFDAAVDLAAGNKLKSAHEAMIEQEKMRHELHTEGEAERHAAQLKFIDSLFAPDASAVEAKPVPKAFQSGEPPV